MLEPRSEIDCVSSLRRTLYSEASAETCAVRVAFEMKLNGFAQVFTYSAYSNEPHRKQKYAPLYRLFESTYEQMRATEGVDENALLYAGTAIFAEYVKQPALVFVYGISILEEYVKSLAHRKLRKYPIMKFKEEEGMAYAFVAGECLAIEAKHPSGIDQLFGGNRLLGQAFAYLSACQMLDVHPANVVLAKDKIIQRDILAARRTMMDKSNPFVVAEVEFDKVWKVFKTPGFDGNILKAMCIAAGIDYSLAIDASSCDSSIKPIPLDCSNRAQSALLLKAAA